MVEVRGFEPRSEVMTIRLSPYSVHLVNIRRGLLDELSMPKAIWDKDSLISLQR